MNTTLLKRATTVGPAQRMIVLLILVLSSFFAWSYFAEVAQVAHATGQVIASSRTQLIQSANEGVIEELLVREGEHVKKGQLLAQLERTQAAAALSDSRGKVAALKAALTRLHAEVLGRPLVFPPEVRKFPAFVANQTELFQRRQRAVNEEARALNDMLASTNEELNLSQPLVGSGDISKVEIIRLRKAVSELEGQITNRRNKYFQDAQAEMTKAEEDLATQEQVLAERTGTIERTELRASSDGIVRNIKLTTSGAKVRAGDVVMELLPTDSALIVEAKFKPADIAFIRPNLDAAVKLDAYDYSIYGVLPGKVIFVSPDALNEDTRAGEHIYYRVQIELDASRLHKTKGGKSIEIQPGMTAQVDVRTGSQTILTYLSKPMTKTVAEAFTER
ncbi:HlyD family type I secretion periplasmic adaptor subunit [soil metagenome]